MEGLFYYGHLCNIQDKNATDHEQYVCSILTIDRHITIQAPVPEKGKGEKAVAASDKPKKSSSMVSFKLSTIDA